MTKTTAQTAAAEIVDQMSHDDVCGFTVAAWRDGISAMLQGEWEGLDLDEVLDATLDLVTDRLESTLEEVAESVRRQLSANTRYTIEARPESRDILVSIDLNADEDYDDQAEDGVLIEAGLRLVDSGDEDGRLWATWTL